LHKEQPHPQGNHPKPRPDFQPAPGQPLPVQKPVTDEEVVEKKPSRVVRLLKRMGLGVLLVLAIVFAYLFLLLGEPEEDAKYQTRKQEETISMPMGALEAPGESNVELLADTFGHPVLSLGQGMTMQKARVYDTAFGGEYARRVTLTYAFEDGQMLTVESIRPTAAATLLDEKGYRLDASSLYTLGGLNAARMDNDDSSCVFAQSDVAVYAVICPGSHADELEGLLRYTTLVAPSADR